MKEADSLVDFNHKTERFFLDCMNSNNETINCLKEINIIFDKSLNVLAKADTFWESLFLRRSWSLFTSAVRVGAGGQSPDVYPLIRTMLETALYAWYIKQDSVRLDIWLNRVQSLQDKKYMRNLFSYKKIISDLEKKHPILAKVIKESYSFYIDFGAHPNFSSIMSGIKENGNSKTFNLSLTHQQIDTSFQLALERITQAGIESLELFRLAFPTNFTSAGIDRMIQKIMTDIDRTTSMNQESYF